MPRTYSNSKSFFDSQHMFHAGRSLTVPFCVQVEYNDRAVELACNRILRVLPGKRLVCDRDYAGQKVVIKFVLIREVPEGIVYAKKKVPKPWIKPGSSCSSSRCVWCSTNAETCSGSGSRVPCSCSLAAEGQRPGKP